MKMSAGDEKGDGGRYDMPNSPETISCPFCNSEVETHAIICGACSAMLTLSDLDALVAHQVPDDSFIRGAIRRIENKSENGELPVTDFVALAIGYLNLNDLDSALDCLREASVRDPNDVMISGQLNTLAIRIDENRRHSETHREMVKGKTILVVDDSATVRKLIAGKLEKCGHNVVCVGDGTEAMETLSGLTPDLILLDVAMPKMDGYQTCRAIRSNPQTAGIPVIMISGKDGFFDKVRGRRAGTTDYITKPFGPETLMRALETYLDAGPAAPAAE
jgi:twitching motility two-component system response regulator PilG